MLMIKPLACGPLGNTTDLIGGDCKGRNTFLGWDCCSFRQTPQRWCLLRMSLAFLIPAQLVSPTGQSWPPKTINASLRTLLLGSNKWCPGINSVTKVLCFCHVGGAHLCFCLKYTLNIFKGKSKSKYKLQHLMKKNTVYQYLWKYIGLHLK